MKIELDIDPQDLTKSLKETLDALPQEKRIEIARRTMEAWLRDPWDIERTAKEREVIERMRQRHLSQESDDQIRRRWDFKQAMGDWKSTKETMVQTITGEISAAYREEVRKVIENDPKIQAMKEEVVQMIRTTFPKAVHDAMVQWMASSMSLMFETTMGIRQSAEATSKLNEEMANRLLQVEGRLANRMS